MIKLFRKIRQNLLSEGKTGKYLKYAIGEIVLVVIGILIALQINTWNEHRKSTKLEQQILNGLLVNLEKDSIQLERIINYLSKSLDAQNKIINTSASELINQQSAKKVSGILEDLYYGAYSFFPNDGYYNSLINDDRIDLIRSEKIKANLIDFYDYKLERYEFMDVVIDDQFQRTLYPFLHRKLGFYINSDFESTVIDNIDFQNYYDELRLHCMDVSVMTNHCNRLLIQMFNDSGVLLNELREEIK